MVTGTTVNIVGAGLLTTIGAGTTTLKWASYMVVNGIGIGMAMQLPYTALQAVLEYAPILHLNNSKLTCTSPDDVATGNGMKWSSPSKRLHRLTVASYCCLFLPAWRV